MIVAYLMILSILCTIEIILILFLELKIITNDKGKCQIYVL